MRRSQSSPLLLPGFNDLNTLFTIMPAGSDSVKVAVRVRPFNQREKTAGSKCVISMKGTTTTITNPESGDTKSFSFDHSYWSHDSYIEDGEGIYIKDTDSSNYADQRQVYSDLGQGVLDNAWQGYNAALFAYGQTGSGKSYSMIGYGPNKGIVPITCEELFKVIDSNKEEKKQLQVSFSMLEIYNEQVKDLLVKAKPQAGGLKIRQNPKVGFYVEGLKQVPVQNYKQIAKLMEQGTFNRTTASTNMNATKSNTRSSDINLVDLAGSERADSTGATGDRLKEGSAINQSLSTLGNVISALADIAMGKKKVMVPYRDSVLTKLAKKIQNKAVVNESPTDRLIRELKEENAKLMAMLKKSPGSPGAAENLEELQRMLEDNERKMKDMNLSWEQRLEQARKEWERSLGHAEELKNEWEQMPHFMNINEDPQLSGIIKHCFTTGQLVMGKSLTSDVDIQIRGLGIQPKHCMVHNNGKEVYLEPYNQTSVVIRNGHKDRIKLGSSSYYLYFGFPKERDYSTDTVLYNYDHFVTEIAEHEGVIVDIQTPRFTQDQDGQDNMDVLVFQDYINLMPLISEANAISEELKKFVHFEAEIKSDASHNASGISNNKEVIIRVINTKTNKVWLWSKGKFLHRKDLMDEMYVQWNENNNTKISRDKDPFWDPVEDIFLGSCHILLKSLAYNEEIDEHFTLHNYHGKEEAVMQVKLLPCDSKGNIKSNDDILEPHELLNKPFSCIIKITQCMGTKWTMDDHSRGVFCKFSFHDQAPVSSKTVWGKSYADIGFQKQFNFKKVNKEFLKYLQSSSLVVELWGSQVSEDKEIHKPLKNRHVTNGNHGNSNRNTEIQLKSIIFIVCVFCNEDEVESLHEECDDLKKENFKLKQSLEHQKQAVKIARSRRNSIPDMDTENNVGLDVELAKALRIFFKDIKSVQIQVKELKEHAHKMKDSDNGSTKTALQKQEQSLQDVDEKLTDCVRALKQEVTATIKKSKS
ncbi:hypothetical protein KUTeg_013251 [Tegillarca granosa]|uniref:Kinesin motor domain-containing protein n=1 Tax=Tegillarca granosa TaxID=220873 RepID=A0ABQ9ET63_TEGGR|nr:hypothetical protein KUTeg_013251 [Tegillarca granosa]